MNDPFLSRLEPKEIGGFVYKNTNLKSKSFIFHLEIIYVWDYFTDSHFIVDDRKSRILNQKSCYYLGVPVQNIEVPSSEIPTSLGFGVKLLGIPSKTN